MTEVEFTATPLSDVAIFLGDYHNISVTFDASAKERVKKLDVPITVTVSGEDLATTLPRILHSVRLSYFVDDGKLQIATPEEVQKRGHPVPESLADVLAKLQKADASMPWERFLLGNATGLPSTSVANATNLEKLTKLLAHADVVVQRHAARSLFCFEKAATPARAALEKLTKSEDRAVRRAAWWALLAIGHEDLSTWPLFLAAWIEGDDVVRSDWFPILAQFDPKVFEKLTALFPTASVGIRQSLASSIRVRGRDDVTEPLALLAFEDADRTVRYIALIASHHEHSESLTAGLRKRLQDEHPPCRVRAADCLLPSSDDRTAAVDVLLSELSRENSSEKDAILSIFANHGRSHGASPIRDLLLRRSVSANEAERIAARRALKVVPEETQTAGVLKHIDLIFEIRKNEPKLSAEQRVQAVDDEMQYLLMTNNPSEEQRARVNHRAAHQFANWDIRQHFALVKKYSEAGLKLDVDPARRASLFSLLGSAALVAPAATTFAEQRRNAAKLWLTGYREVESLKLPKSAPELPVVEKLADVAGESPEQQAAREQQHATQLETRQQAEYTRQMIEHRHQLAHLLVETFRREPADEPELRKLATEALTERSLVEALLTEGAVPLGAAPGNSRPQ